VEINLTPSIPLDQERFPAAHLVLSETPGVDSVCLWPVGPDPVSILSLADILVSALAVMPQAHLETLLEFLRARPRCPLAPAVSTESQAAGIASAIWGYHRVDASSEQSGFKALFETVGELVASPRGSFELLALEVIAYQAGQRWRLAGQVRDPRQPEELLDHEGFLREE
jgi:hypothetical protein